MTCKILIRPYKYGDELKLKRLLADSAMTTVWSVFLGKFNISELQLPLYLLYYINCKKLGSTRCAGTS